MDRVVEFASTILRVNALDYLVLLGTLLGIAGYGIWRTRQRQDLKTYLKGSGQASALAIGLSVMATQASAITFLSTPGQGYRDGLGFVQNYFGAPFALIFISVVFLPIYQKLGVFTAYEYLGHRFDAKTRQLGAGFFLLQRGLGAGITIYAPAIVLSTVMGWRLDLTIIGTGLLATIYTVSGGSDAVNVTQKYQLALIFGGMLAAGCLLVAHLPAEVTLGNALTIATHLHHLDAVDYSLNLDRRYTFWSGMLGGGFLALSYFGTDQSQVGRYLSTSSLRESRLGLMFNAVFKIPMQFFILLLGVLMFVFYQFELPPIYFNRVAWNHEIATGTAAGNHLLDLQSKYAAAHAQQRHHLDLWLQARQNAVAATTAQTNLAALQSDHAELEHLGAEARETMQSVAPNAGNDADYIFVTFILQHLPHGLIGLLVAAFFAAALGSKAGELTALGSTTVVDLYKPIVSSYREDTHYLRASRWLTAGWGLIAIVFALYAHLSENLIQAVNILGSIFYGVVLGVFMVAFFCPRVEGTAVFFAALVTQAVIFLLYWRGDFSYLWLIPIGCFLCMGLSCLLQFHCSRRTLFRLSA